jgi:hypothetical protein
MIIRYYQVIILRFAGTSVDILAVKITLAPILTERSMRDSTAERVLEVRHLLLWRRSFLFLLTVILIWTLVSVAIHVV